MINNCRPLSRSRLMWKVEDLRHAKGHPDKTRGDGDLEYMLDVLEALGLIPPEAFAEGELEKFAAMRPAAPKHQAVPPGES